MCKYCLQLGMYKCFNSEIDVSLLDRTPFQFKQNFAGHPALTLKNITETIPQLDQRLVFFSGRKMEKGEDFEKAITEGRKVQSIEDVIANLSTSSSYIMLREPEAHPAFQALHAELVADITNTVRARGQGSAPIDPRSYIFISSPGSITPFHFDRASNFLLQIQGSKEVSVFSPLDDRVITAADYESHIEYQEGSIQWKPESESFGQKFVCRAGDALHIPFLAGHHVKNGPEVSITLSIFFNDKRSSTQLNALKYNHKVRNKLQRLGWAPFPVGRVPLLDSFKSLAHRAHARLRR